MQLLTRGSAFLCGTPCLLHRKACQVLPAQTAQWPRLAAAPRCVFSSMSTGAVAKRVGLSEEKVAELVTEGIHYPSPVKIGRSGICSKLRSQLDLRLRNVEVVKIQAPRDQQHMMKAIQTQLEDLMPFHSVIWLSGSKLVLYRGKDYIKPRHEPASPASHEELEQHFEGGEAHNQPDVATEPGSTQAVATAL